MIQFLIICIMSGNFSYPNILQQFPLNVKKGWRLEGNKFWCIKSDLFIGALNPLVAVMQRQSL